MAQRTDLLFRTDAYLREAAARVVAVNDDGGIILDRTIFFATGGGQPGDSGILVLDDGTAIPVATAIYGADKGEIVHLPGDGSTRPAVGTAVTARIDWQRRLRHMRMHTALHLLSVALPFPVTGGRIGADESHLDFDIVDAVPVREVIDRQLEAMVEADHPVTDEWITDDELLANPGLVKTMSVMPPLGSGRVRLVRIGDIDLQPCGGTHVRSTGEIGRVKVSKIENKGRQNRRVRLRFAEEA